MTKGSNMSELSIHELEAQTGEVLPEREALSVFAFNSFNRHIDSHNTTTTTTHITTVTATNSSNSAVANSFLSSSHSSATQSVSVVG
jgi:hypothetical protein